MKCASEGCTDKGNVILFGTGYCEFHAKLSAEYQKVDLLEYYQQSLELLNRRLEEALKAAGELEE